MTNGLNHRYMVRNFAIPSAAWDPSQLPGLVAWYDASNAASITATAGLVSQWNDLSGNAHNLTGSITTQPVNNSVTQNGLVGITFDNTNDFMAVAGSITEAPTSRIRYIACVWKVGGSLAAEPTLWAPSSSDGFEFRLRSATGSSGDGDVLESGIAHHTPTADDGTPAINTAYVTEVQCLASGSGINYWRNAGTTRTNSDAFTFSSAGTTYSVGLSTQPIGGTLFEFVVVDSTIGGTSDQTSLRNYLNAKWAVY